MHRQKKCVHCGATFTRDTWMKKHRCDKAKRWERRVIRVVNANLVEVGGMPYQITQQGEVEAWVPLQPAHSKGAEGPDDLPGWM